MSSVLVCPAVAGEGARRSPTPSPTAPAAAAISLLFMVFTLFRQGASGVAPRLSFGAGDGTDVNLLDEAWENGERRQEEPGRS